MHTAPWLTILLAIPLVGAIVVALIPKTAGTFAKQLTLALTLVELVVAVIATAAYRPNVPGFQFAQQYDWIKQFGVSY